MKQRRPAGAKRTLDVIGDNRGDIAIKSLHKADYSSLMLWTNQLVGESRSGHVSPRLQIG
jgi:hypothetical protein